MSLPALRQQLSALLSPIRVGGTAAIPTGIPVLDRALSDGGVPSGRLTEVAGARGSGRTTLVRQLVQAAVTARRWVAVIDGSRTLAPREWAGAGDSGRLWVVRPHAADRSAWCADILLRSGAFSLVVLDGAPALPRTIAVRLTRLAREHDVALVVVGDSPIVGSAVRMRVARASVKRKAQGAKHTHDSRFPIPDSRHKATGHRPQATGSAESRVTNHESRSTNHESRLSVVIEKGGVQHAVEVRCAIEVARRLRTHPEVPDRRGVAKRNRWGQLVPSAPGTTSVEREGTEHPGGGAAPRKRRFAEARSTRDGFLLDERSSGHRPQATGHR
jgi:hypothetical protein